MQLDTYGVLHLTFDPQPGDVMLCHDELGRTFNVELISPVDVEDDGSVAFWMTRQPGTAGTKNRLDWQTIDADLFVGRLCAEWTVA